MAKRESNRREFLQLAESYKWDKDDISGYYVSEKLDGGRCFWDGGISRGVLTEQVPWASVTDPKTGNRKAKIKAEATGLWSRYGNPITAPDWFLNQLPCCPLDGELWAGRGKFQTCMSAIRKDVPVDQEWRQIKYVVYSSPAMASVFASGEIKNANMRCAIDEADCLHWCLSRRDHVPDMNWSGTRPVTFEEELAFLSSMIDSQNDHVYMHRQIRLSVNPQEQVERFLSDVLDQGGEGVILRDPSSYWTPKRHRGVLKYKPFDDDEGRLVGFTSGRETDKGSRLLGKIGALVLDYQGKRLELAGLTDSEREFFTLEMSKYASLNPGVDMPPDFVGKHFKPGQNITFKFRELSDDGIPKEARYFRVREKES